MQKVVGIDEVGRGSWAGPVVAGAVMLTQTLEGLKDSKFLSKNHREQLAAHIYNTSLATGLGWVSPREVDQLGLSKAVGLAMERALKQISINYDKIIIDGKYNFMPANPKANAVIRADTYIPAVSAASVIAKVARDNYMKSIAAQFPLYHFEKHVGYGTYLHAQMLKLHGACELHRFSYKPVKILQ